MSPLASGHPMHPFEHMPPPEPGAVHLWWIPLDRLPARGGGRGLLSPAERLRADRLPPPARRRFIAARAALRRILAAYVERPPSALRFRHGPEGKPFLLRGGPAFNLSHSGGLALLAVIAGGPHRTPLGVDLEVVPRRLPQAAERFFTREEHRILEASDRPCRLFADLWTVREAALKARGGRLFRDIAALAPEIRRGGLPVRGRIDGLAYRLLPAPPGYAACLVTPRPPRRIFQTSFPSP